MLKIFQKHPNYNYSTHPIVIKVVVVGQKMVVVGLRGDDGDGAASNYHPRTTHMSSHDAQCLWPCLPPIIIQTRLKGTGSVGG